MTNDQYELLLTNGSASLRAVNNPRSDAVMERVARNAPLEPTKAQKGNTGRIHISIVSVRKRLLDPDNCAAKWHLDCLRYIKAIPGDEPDKITLEVSQRKAGKNEEEQTEIEITYPLS